jgi:hypothetical protein
MYKGHDIASGPLTDRQALSDRINHGNSRLSFCHLNIVAKSSWLTPQ